MTGTPQSMGFAPPKIVGIVNITEDSFSDGGAFLSPDAAIARCERLIADGADVLDLGAASSNPDAKQVASAEEIKRLEPVVAAMLSRGAAISIDTFKPEVQRWAMTRVAYLNDIRGFPEPAIYPELARARCALIVMHSMQRDGQATRTETDAATVIRAMYEFFEKRLAALASAGIDRERLILDPGMGFFLGGNPEPSLRALRSIPKLRDRFGLPIHISVSRKSFLGAITGRPVAERGAATLAAEAYAVLKGADYIRTHDVRQLHDGIRVLSAIEDSFA